MPKSSSLYNLLTDNQLLTLLADDVEQTEGFVTFSLTNGPEYHISQVSDSNILFNLLRKPSCIKYL